MSSMRPIFSKAVYSHVQQLSMCIGDHGDDFDDNV